MASDGNGSPSTLTNGSVFAQVSEQTVPPDHGAYRTLVLCFDGKGDSFDADNSNIVQLFSMLKKDDRSKQMVYYQAGIGTYTIPEIATPLMAKVSKAIDMAVAKDLDAHVMGGYEFLMQNYQANDRICIFGFSRGAYTARALAGMIHKVGLLPTCNHQQVPFAYKMFTRDDPVGWKQSNAFKKAFSINVEVYFIGVWDTVASVGLIAHRLPFTASNKAVRFFRHAISLDEHRAKFMSNHWQPSSQEDHNLGVSDDAMPRSNRLEGPPRVHPEHAFHHHESGAHGKGKLKEAERMYDSLEADATERHNWETDVLEVYFAGCHCDVGGGSVPNGTRHSLARIPLRWMIRQCFLAGTGILFHRDAFAEIGLDHSRLCPVVAPRPVAEDGQSMHGRKPTERTLVDADAEDAPGKLSEEEEDLRDALSPIYDELQISKGWWILEVLPLRHKVHHAVERKFTMEWIMNLGRARDIPRHMPLHVHRSVKTRMEAVEDLEGKSLKYTPRSTFSADPIWVD
ncbi:hypothetical protein OF83DRAFT_772062 [Amylostereum chailletii]|nr:hypothetical protein OF83DRAFT_772062 [Amylostereum chailletii]